MYESKKLKYSFFILKLGTGQSFQPSSVDTKSNRLSVQIDNTSQQEHNNSNQDIKRSASNGNLLKTGNNGTNTPFISRAASYNSAVGHFGSEHKEPSVRNLDASHGHRSERTSISNSNNLHDNSTALNRGTIFHLFILFFSVILLFLSVCSNSYTYLFRYKTGLQKVYTTTEKE